MSRLSLSCPLVLITLLSVCVFAFAADSTNSTSGSSLCASGSTPFVLSSTCPPGWYCPYYNASDAATYPAQCAPTNECLLDRLKTKFCDAQGKYEPILCPKGYYCPSPNEKLECPSGSFCPIGQFQPLNCGSLTTCSAGSQKKFEYSSLIAIIIVDVSALALYYATGAYIRHSNKKREEKYAEFKLTSINPSLHAKGDMFEHLPPQSKMLCQGFRRAHQQLPPMHLQFNELSLTIPGVNGKKDLTILKGVTGSIEPGKVTAIMGPSGAGKTTFLNTMLGKLDPTWKKNGLVNVNGVEEQLGRFRKIIGYVPQEDVMHRDLTVYENIAYSARTRLPHEWTSEQVEAHINSVIGAIGLAHVQNSPIGDELTRGISGGQRKRVNIGMEIAAAPSLLLLDEPTSGLDSTAAMSICQLLTDLARVSRLTVAMVIHQPRVEIWNQLDELLLLAPGGLTVYQGPQKLSVLYFALRCDIHLKPQENPADALLDAVAEQAKEFVESWKNGGREYVEMLQAQYGHLTNEQITERTLDPAFQQQVSSGNYKFNDNEAALSVDLQINNSSVRSQQSSSKATRKVSDASASPTGNGTNAVYVNGKQPAVAWKTELRTDSELVEKSSFQENEYELKDIKVIAPTSLTPASVTAPRDTFTESPHRAFPQGSLRTTASFFHQMYYAFCRSLLKQYKNMGSLFLEVGLALLAGGFMGAGGKMTYQGVLQYPFVLLTPSTVENVIPSLCFNIALGVALAAASAGVNVYGEEKAVRHREISSGHSLNAYYLGVSFAQTFRQFIDAIHFTWLYHIIGQPITTFGELLPFMFLLYLAVYNLAAIVSMIVQRKNATLLGVVISLLVCSMTAKNDVVPEFIQVFSPTRWMSEGLFDRETRFYTHVMQVNTTSDRLNYTLGRFETDVVLCCLVGNLYRLIAWLLMRWVDRKVIAK